MEPLKLKLGSTFSSLGASSSSASSPKSSGGLSQTRIQSGSIKENVHYRNQGKLSIGEINRFVVEYDFDKDDGNVLSDEHGDFLWLRVRNIETQFFRPIYFTGPFSFYIDVTPYNFDHKKDFTESIQFNNDIKPGQSFKAKLRITENSRKKGAIYSWTIDVVAQLAMTTKFVINYDFMIGYDYRILRKTTSETVPDEAKALFMTVVKKDTKDLWQKPPRRPDDHVHLVIITHGIFSNVGADMLYIKEEIEKAAEPNESSNIIVRGYDGNVGKSEKGIRYLGKRVAKFVMDLCDDSKYKIDRISFVGHSLGGPVQAYAISQIVSTRPEFFNSIQPINFINLAAPFLGILSDFPIAVSWALDVGALGKTGRDLTLSHRFPSVVKRFKKDANQNETDTNTKVTSKPILEVIPIGPAHEIFERFQNRTVYANAVNDGIVPLRTSALLYLDWKGLGDLKKLKKKYEESVMQEDSVQHGQRVRKGSVSEIPEDDKNDRNSIVANVGEDRRTVQYNESDLEQKRKSNGAAKFSGSSSKSRNENNVSDLNVRNQSSDSEVKSSNSKAKSSTDSTPFSIDSTLNSKTNSSSILKSPTVMFKEKPKKSRRKKLKKYIRTQTKTNVKEEDWVDVNEGEGAANDEMAEFNIPPAASTFLSAANVIMSPMPKDYYFMYPDRRVPTIFHDKRYTFDDLPPPHFAKKLKNAKAFKSFIKRDKNVIEERIAREWHWKMEWRKVLVTLKPDAHNNIAVRRKFSNAFGWGVIDHLVENHFGKEAIDKEIAYISTVRESASKKFNSNIEGFN